MARLSKGREAQIRGGHGPIRTERDLLNEIVALRAQVAAHEGTIRAMKRDTADLLEVSKCTPQVRSCDEPDVIGHRLRKKRLAAGLTQDQLARSSGATRPLISQYENGARYPSLPTFISLLIAMRCDANEIIITPTTVSS